MELEENNVPEEVSSDQVDSQQSQSENEDLGIPQAQVNKIVERTRNKARDEGYKKAMEEVSSQGNQSSGNDEDAYNKFAERFNKELEQQVLEQQGKQIRADYDHKLEKGRESYDDFDEVTKIFKPDKFPHLAAVTAGLDGGEDILYEISKNPSKIGILHNLITHDPDLAEIEITKLQDSIKLNKKAKDEANNNKVSSPLEPLTSSKSTYGNGSSSYSSLRNDPRLRG